MSLFGHFLILTFWRVLLFLFGSPRLARDWGYEIDAITKQYFWGGEKRVVIIKASTNISTNEHKHEKDRQSKDVFEYLKKLSAAIGFSYNGKSILLSQYEQLVKPNKQSVLYQYLSKSTIVSRTNEEMMIFPFGVNLSQRKAVEMAMENSVSIIEGPPGTGKTQTILNIVANIVRRGKTVGIVSGNNSATENVQEKLEKHGYGFMTALLGNASLRKEFFEKHQSQLPDMTVWRITEDEEKALSDQLEATTQTLTKLLENQRELAKLKEELSKFQLEQRYFESSFIGEYITKKEYSFRKVWTPEDIIKFIMQIEGLALSNKGITFKSKVQVFFQYGVYKFGLFEQNRNHIINSLKREYYKNNIEDRNGKIKELEMKLNTQSYHLLLESYEELSSKLFRASFSRKYSRLDHGKRGYSAKDYKYRFSEFTKDYPVILSTTHSILNAIPKEYLFDYIIIDEASQVDLVTASLALACCKNVVIVGDVKQLPHIVSPEMKELSANLFSEYSIEEAYDYNKYSIIESLMNLYEHSLPTTFLSEHYRCHPKIIGFCNAKYYNNQLVVMTQETPDDTPLKIYKTAPGNHARKSRQGESQGWYNVRQIEVIKDEIIAVHGQRYSDCGDVGIISPFRMHVIETNQRITYPALEVDTVHRFQGREKKTIIFPTVANKISSFIDDPNLINVAVSRAVDELVVVTSDKLYKQQGSQLGDLIRYIEYNSFDSVIESQKVSVFDLLYTEYSKVLLQYRNQGKRVSEYQSENLMYAIIEEVLALPEFKSFKCVIHIPLNTLVIDYSDLTVEEQKFARNPWSHVDFLIFNKLDKEALLAVEVDGVMFHHNEKQRQRDTLKDSVLSKSNLPLLRVATNESGEKEKLIAKLMEIIKQSEF